ncbi:NAD(P)-dependent oxidoreductase [Pseudomonas sp. H3_H08]
MSLDPILLMGGSGAIGHHTARALRAAHPDVPLLIGGRDLAKAQRAAEHMGGARGVLIDSAADDLGLGDRPVSGVVVFYMDHALAGLRFAQKRGVPHLSISSGVFEIAPEIATYMHRPDASPIVLGYEWLVGATTVSTLSIAQAFGRVHDIRINALVDEQDTGGPTVASDFEHLNKMLPAALTRRDGVFVWREGEASKASFHAVDGTEIEASGFSSIDVVGLATATGAPNVQFNLATAVSLKPTPRQADVYRDHHRTRWRGPQGRAAAYTSCGHPPGRRCTFDRPQRRNDSGTAARLGRPATDSARALFPLSTVGRRRVSGASAGGGR